jgi:hypothetical protein
MRCCVSAAENKTDNKLDLKFIKKKLECLKQYRYENLPELTGSRSCKKNCSFHKIVACAVFLAKTIILQ